MSNHERDLHDTDLSRLYRQGVQSEPGPELDEHIRALAHRAVQRRGLPWWKLASTAAVLVLSFALVTETLLLTPEEKTTDLAPAPKVEAEQAAPAGQMMPKPQTYAEPKARHAKELKRSTEAMRKKQSARAVGDSVGFDNVMPSAPASVSGLKFDGPAGTPMAERALREEMELSMPSCGGYPIPESSDEADWLKLAEILRGQGQVQELACLRAAFAERFGKQLPEQAEPQYPLITPK